MVRLEQNCLTDDGQGEAQPTVGSTIPTVVDPDCIRTAQAEREAEAANKQCSFKAPASVPALTSLGDRRWPGGIH